MVRRSSCPTSVYIDSELCPVVSIQRVDELAHEPRRMLGRHQFVKCGRQIHICSRLIGRSGICDAAKSGGFETRRYGLAIHGVLKTKWYKSPPSNSLTRDSIHPINPRLLRQAPLDSPDTEIC